MTEFPTTVTITTENVQFTGRANDLSRRLTKAGIPFLGLARDRIDFAEGITQEAQDLGNGILAAWDWDAPPVPDQVTATQAKLALVDAGLYEAIEAWVAGEEAYPDGIRYRIVWNAATWYRTSQELNEIATDIGLTGDQIDDLFRLAATK